MISLYPFQGTLVSDLSAAFRQYMSVLLVLPTGGGKTVCFSYLAGRMLDSGHRTIIMAHREELLEQISKTLTAFGIRHGMIAAGVEYDPEPLIHVASVMTLVRKLDIVQAPKWLIIDEAHHAIASSSYGKIVNPWRASNPKMRLLGVTATPIRLSGQGLGVQAEGPFEHMVQGPSVRWLIDNGYLSNYRLVVPPSRLDLSKLHKRAGDYVRGEVEVQLDRPQIVGDVIGQYRKLLNGAPTVLFAPSINSAEMFAQRFRDAGFQAMSVDGKMDKDLRRTAISDFRRGAIQVMASCALIDEGFDLPGIMGAIDCSPTESLARVLQRWGRALRKAPGKDRAILIDHVGNSGSMESGEFVPKHGLPDDERHWSLMGREKGQSDDEARMMGPKRCGECLSLSTGRALVCSECGSPFPVKEREVQEVSGTLSEVDLSSVRRQERMAQGQCKTLQELYDLAKQLGRKPAWAELVWSAKEKKRREMEAKRSVPEPQANLL